VAQRPGLYALATSLAARVLGVLGGRRRSLLLVRLMNPWTQHRDLPSFKGRTFRDLYRTRRPG
jgi:hypothetical protein